MFEFNYLEKCRACKHEDKQANESPCDTCKWNNSQDNWEPKERKENTREERILRILKRVEELSSIYE